jgi:hypothetical protein
MYDMYCSSFEYRIILGHKLESLGDALCKVIPGLKRVLFSEETNNQAIGLITRHGNETILFVNVRCLPLFLRCSIVSLVFRLSSMKETWNHL